MKTLEQLTAEEKEHYGFWIEFSAITQVEANKEEALLYANMTSMERVHILMSVGKKVFI